MVRLEGLEAVFDVDSWHSDQELESDAESDAVDCTAPSCAPAAGHENWD